MSSTPTGRYKSRFFNFLNRQYRRWVDRGDRTIRHAKVATTWGVQALLYPVFFLFQSARQATLQLQQAIKRDINPQQRTLPHPETGDSLPAAGENLPKQILPVRLFQQVMGWVQTSPIASVVNLFQPDNQVMRLEKKRQQLKLKSQELKLNHQELNLNNWQPSANSSPLDSQQEEVQTEALLLSETEAEIDPHSEELPPPFIAALDRAIASWEVGGLLPVSKMTSSLVESQQKLFQRVRNRLISTVPSESDSSLNNPPKVDELLQVKQNQLFSDRHPKVSAQPSPLIGAVTSLELPLELEEDPWLTPSDLFGNAGSVSPQTENVSSERSPSLNLSENNKVSAAGSLPPAQQINIIENKIISFIKQYVKPKQPLANRPQTQSDLVVSPPQNSAINKVPPHSSNQITSPTPNVSQSISNYTKKDDSLNINSGSNPSSDCIETEAKQVGYIKHPLERILEWIDIALLRLEEIIMMVWEWLKKLRAQK